MSNTKNFKRKLQQSSVEDKYNAILAGHMIIASVKIIELITKLFIGQQNYFLANYNNNTTSSEQRISYYRSDDTDVEAEEIVAPVYKKTQGGRKIYDPQGTFETESDTRGPGRPKNAKRELIKQ
ncbi:hypothetical protein BpHYR1_050428 [Brachionus plicatilis]|uniref:Uncharacterized protein n=1 Tax=Brachionus plicatilis TaxID=10195 RepID=A0A3M7T0J9_BRAPC|nr:hypothetical protein BpHYR1_050428 [Brachionus plicatilis]